MVGPPLQYGAPGTAAEFQPLWHTAHGNRANSAKKLESRGEIGPFAARFCLAGHRLAAAENRLSRETPVQNGASFLVASSPLLERPKISPRFQFFGNFRPPRLRRHPGNGQLDKGSSRASRPAAPTRPDKSATPNAWPCGKHPLGCRGSVTIRGMRFARAKRKAPCARTWQRAMPNTKGMQ